MRSYDDTDKYDIEELAKLKVESWMLETLKINPDYVFWGTHEDYMCDKSGGWSAPVEFETWKDFRFDLDDLNECVHFYFELRRQNTLCATCDGSGYAPQAKVLHDSFYRGWEYSLTDDEAKALSDNGRLVLGLCPGLEDRYGFKELEGWVLKEGAKIPTGAEVVQAKSFGSHSFHDGINHLILVKARCKRLGFPLKCPACGGSGRVYTADKGHLSFTTWIIHPRKGASRGVEVKVVEQADLPAIYSFLREAASRNAKRFSKVPPA